MADELQPWLSRTLGSKASVGSLTSLVKTLKEPRKTAINGMKGNLRVRGHKLFDAMKKFMVMLVVEESLSLTLASMLMTVLSDSRSGYHHSIVKTQITQFNSKSLWAIFLQISEMIDMVKLV